MEGGDSTEPAGQEEHIFNGTTTNADVEMKEDGQAEGKIYTDVKHILLSNSHIAVTIIFVSFRFILLKLILFTDVLSIVWKMSSFCDRFCGVLELVYEVWIVCSMINFL